MQQPDKREYRYYKNPRGRWVIQRRIGYCPWFTQDAFRLKRNAIRYIKLQKIKDAHVPEYYYV